MLNHGFAGAVGQHPSVVQPMNGVGRAGFAGQVCSGCAGVDVDFSFFTADLADGKCNRGGRHIDNHVDLVSVIPLARNVRADVRLVLVVSTDDFNLQTAFAALQIIFNSHFGGNHRSWPGDFGIQTRHVVEHADLDDAVGDLGRCIQADSAKQGCEQSFNWEFHGRVLQKNQIPKNSLSIGILACNCAASKPCTMRPCSIT